MATPRVGVDPEALARFLDECVVEDPNGLVPHRELWNLWLRWIKVHDVWHGGVTKFYAALRVQAPHLTYYRGRDETGRRLPRAYRGITLKEI